MCASLVSSCLVLSRLVLLSCVTLVACFVFLCCVVSCVGRCLPLCVCCVGLLSPGSGLVSRLSCFRVLVSDVSRCAALCCCVLLCVFGVRNVRCAECVWCGRLKNPPCERSKRPRGRGAGAHGGRFESDTRTHAHTEDTHTWDPNRIKNNKFSDKIDVFFLTHRKMSHALFFQMSVAGRPERARAAGAPWTHNVACDGVIHSRIFNLRVEPSSARKDIPRVLRCQLNLCHFSSSAAVSTQNLDLPGCLPHPGFPGSAEVTRHKKIRLERSSNPWCRLASALDSRWIPDVFPTPWCRSFSARPSFLPSCLRSRSRRVQVRCFPLRCALLVHQRVPTCLSVRR